MRLQFDYRAMMDELRGLDMNNVGSWPLFAQAGACALTCLAIVLAGYWFLVRPQLATLKQARRRELQLKREFARKQHKVANLHAYEKQLREMKQDFGQMLKQLPSKGEVANLLNDISQTRAAAGLSEQLFKPSGEIKRDFYAELPNQIKVMGTYHQLANFVSGVAALPRIVTVHHITIHPVNNTGGRRKAGNGGGHQHVLAMSAVLTTYRYLQQGGGESTAGGHG